MKKAVLIAAMVAHPALAQQIDATDDIIVTAQMREQDPIEVPIALSVLTGADLDQLGIREFDQLSRFTPGFVVQNQSPNNPGFVMRGITSDSGSAFVEPRVSVFQDGVSISRSRGSYVELFDMERVEVAKGPQSTLYGRGALIGAVNMVQNKADPSRLAGMARASYGNLNAWSAEAMLNVPFDENFAVRVAGRLRKRDGYTENLLGGRDFNSADTGAIRGAIHAQSGGLTIDVIGNYQKDSPAGTAFKSIAYNPTDPVTGAVIGDRGRNSGAALAPAAGFEGGAELGLDRKVWGFTGIAKLELDERFTLTSISAYRTFHATEIFDADGISMPMLTAAEEAFGEQFSTELRLGYESGPLTAFVGASYFNENGYQRTPAQFDERALLARLTNTLSGPIPGRPATDPMAMALLGNTAFTGALLQGVAAQYGKLLPAAQAQAIAANLKPGHLETSTNDARTSAVDLFGDVNLRLGDQFELGAGLRYTHDSKRSGYTAAVLNGRSILGGVIGALSLPEPLRSQLLGALAVPGAANIPQSALFPVPLFGLGLQPTTGNGTLFSQTHKDGGFSWRLNARYAATDDLSFYASYARGRRPEVLAASAPSAPGGAARFAVLDAETVDSFEIGGKGAFADRSLFIDVSAYLYNYNNFQTTVQQGTQIITTNAGKARSHGVEAQLRWRASDSFSMFANYGWNHGRFRTGIREGNAFRLSPDHSASAGFEASTTFGGLRAYLAPSLTWQSSIFFDDDNDRPDLQQPPAALVPDNIQDEYQGGYALLNLRVGIEQGGWRLEAFADNLLNEKYIMDAGNTGDALGMPTFIAGAPRLYGISASFRF